MRTSSALAVTLCILASICRLQTAVEATFLKKTVQITHYTHETRGGPNGTFLLAAGTPQPDLGVGAAFGSFVVYDNVMREGASPTSQMIGRIAGTAVGVVKPSSTPDNNTRVQIVMQHIFGEASQYNGSTIDVVGIFFFNPPWEMRVPGATGKLRGYTGYGLCQPISQTTGAPPLLLVYRWDFYLTKTEDF
ncbi:hypothetical protein M758_12G024100 [Ceratodon purpureus]|nr:hypothetical protein M758_12G024100 [Ceratodon purpureus]